MACPHAAGCPLFPLLRSSLRGWRDYYCDSGDRWGDCARYQMSLTGEPVPISLLPNGHSARHLQDPAGAGTPGMAGPGRTHTAPAWSQPAPPGPVAEPSGYRAAAGEAGAWFANVPPAAADPYQAAADPYQRQAAPAYAHQAPDDAARDTRQAPRAKRGRWARLVDWMKSPS
ncbi:hypothetical protein [Streptomyces sp. NPDC047130]|uniref:hypothetical protein n=1 Tax=Streptomyces sp. NPDC047130 TaxID=3155261 RepID=UPI0033FDD49E